MKIQKLFVVYFIFTINSSFSQTTIKGKVLNRDTNEPIVYANIGISNSNIGTISNPDGSFEILIPKKHATDTLFFSALGFGKRSTPIPTLLKETTIVYLREKVSVLDEVLVNEKKAVNKIFELGNNDFKGGIITTDTTYAGRSNSLLIENKGPQYHKELQYPVYVTKASLRIFKNNLKSFKFRLRINEVDSLTGSPGRDLLQKSMIAESTMRSGWLDFDLSQLNLVTSKPFFITFEQILTKADRVTIANGYRDFIQKNPTKIKNDTVVRDGKKEVRYILKGSAMDLPGVFVAIAVSQFAKENYNCYVRETSFGEWKKVRGILTATVTLSNQLVAPKRKVQPLCSDNSVDCSIAKMCEDFLDETGMVGLQVCASVKGKIKLSKSFGYADIENKIQVTDSTKFRLASISKSMSAAALVKLVSEGKIDLDLPIQKYIPNFPEKKYPVTTRQLAGHLSGFRDYISVADYVHYDHYDNATQALKVFEKDTLLFNPGSKFYYSFLGWPLIGAIIESVSQKDYLTYMKENIFKPMQLLNTCGDNVRTKISNRSKFYNAAGEENDEGDKSHMYANAGLLSTAENLVKFGNAMMYNTSKAGQELLFTSQKTLDGKETGYGIGWYVGIDKNGHRYWHHSGDGFSCSSHLLIYPDDDVVIAFLANGQEGAAFDIEELAKLYVKKLD
jgi:CubicO group peptidase (beta-lactamase class C family)